MLLLNEREMPILSSLEPPIPTPYRIFNRADKGVSYPQLRTFISPFQKRLMRVRKVDFPSSDRAQSWSEYAGMSRFDRFSIG
jgi:hypothetical protein